jgi:hypothetical protein
MKPPHRTRAQSLSPHFSGEWSSIFTGVAAHLASKVFRRSRAPSSVPDEPPPTYEACTKGEKSRADDGVSRNSDSKAPPTSFLGGESLTQEIQDAPPAESLKSKTKTAMEFCVAAKGKQIAAEAEREKRFKFAVWGSPDYWEGYDMVDGARKAHREAEKTLQHTLKSAIRAGMTRPDADKIFKEGAHTDSWARDAVWPVWSQAQRAVDTEAVTREFGDGLD